MVLRYAIFVVIMTVVLNIIRKSKKPTQEQRHRKNLDALFGPRSPNRQPGGITGFLKKMKKLESKK